MAAKKEEHKFGFVNRYRQFNDSLALKQKREKNSGEHSTAEINEQLRQWRLATARRIGKP